MYVVDPWPSTSVCIFVRLHYLNMLNLNSIACSALVFCTYKWVFLLKRYFGNSILTVMCHCGVSARCPLTLVLRAQYAKLERRQELSFRPYFSFVNRTPDLSTSLSSTVPPFPPVNEHRYRKPNAARQLNMSNVTHLGALDWLGRGIDMTSLTPFDINSVCFIHGTIYRG